MSFCNFKPLASLPLLASSVSGFVLRLSAAGSPRERLSLAANWKFQPGDIPRAVIFACKKVRRR